MPEEPSLLNLRRLIEKISRKAPQADSGAASDAEVRQREATRARIESMSEQQEERVRMATQERSGQAARGAGFGGYS